MSKKLVAAIITSAAVTVGNVLTDVAIIKRKGWKYNPKTKQYEKYCDVPALDELDTETAVQTANLVWVGIGLVTGLIVNKLTK